MDPLRMLKDVLCPWDSHENKKKFTGEDLMEEFKTEDVEDIPDINEDSNQNDGFVTQLVKCYYCTKQMDRSIVRAHMQKSHATKPVIFNIMKDTKCLPKDDKTKIIAIIKEEEINPPLEFTMEQESTANQPLTENLGPNGRIGRRKQ